LPSGKELALTAFLQLLASRGSLLRLSIGELHRGLSAVDIGLIDVVCRELGELRMVERAADRAQLAGDQALSQITGVAAQLPSEQRREFVGGRGCPLDRRLVVLSCEL